MARQTRAQRRDRRRQEAEAAGSGGIAQRALARQAQVRPQQQAKAQTGARKREEGGARRFFAESWGELKKVEWPSQSHVMQGTVVVLIACIIVGFYIWVADIAFKHFVQEVLLR